MEWYIPLAAKSLLIAGGALLLLKLMKNRSASDRSWIAHLALAGLLLLPVATVALPTFDVAGPEFLVGKAEVQSPAPALLPVAGGRAQASAPVADESADGGATIDWPFWGYAVPAVLLLLLTLIALGRLFVLKARATVLVDAPWLTALARAQKRMGFKHGTALLTSNELPSPISWGVVRPVILLNSEAAESHGEAEAIITHELAHVAHLDWAKLLLARVAVALFWFNPLVWLLAREAHQLREESADDAVLATDIEDTEYAKLLVGVARHECRGLLIGAHGVAPAKNSLARRVKRVLDGAARRAPGGWRWGSAAAFFAAGMAVPVAALNLVPAQVTAPAADPSHKLATTEAPNPYYSSISPTGDAIGNAAAIGTTAGTAAARATSEAVSAMALNSAGSSITTNARGETVLRAADGRTVTISAAGPDGRRKMVANGPQGMAVAWLNRGEVPSAVPVAPMAKRDRAKSPIDRAIEMRAVGVTPDYVAAIRSAAPQIRFDEDDIVQLKAVGVPPSFIQELSRLGYRNLDADEITGAYAVGVRESYVHDIAAAGYGRLSLDDLTQLKAVGIRPSDVERFRQAGFDHLDVDKLVQLKTLGITPEQLRASERYGP